MSTEGMPTEGTMRSIEETIAHDSHVFCIHPSAHQEAPKINPALFSPIFLEKVKRLTDQLGEYVTAPIIEDTFVDHTERTNWMFEIHATYGLDHYNFLLRNRLRGNRFNMLKSGLPLLLQWYAGEKTEELKECIEKVIQEVNRYPNEQYHHLPTSEKISYVNGITDLVYAVFQNLA